MAKIKTTHVLGTLLLLTGGFYLFHMWKSHGSFKQTLSGIGIG
jgi:hypothetical protein